MELTKMQESYFKDSKIRDNNNLLVCYHASKAKFDTFDKEYIGCGKGSSFGHGFYFSSEPIPTYGENVAVYLDVHNPYILDLNNQENLRDFAEKIDVSYSELQGYIEYAGDVKGGISKTLKENKDVGPLREKGFDGLVILNTSVGLLNQPKQYIDKEIVVFEPEQIKAVDNLFPTTSKDFKDNLTTLIQDLPTFSTPQCTKIAKCIKEYQEVLSKEDFEKLRENLAKNPSPIVREEMAKNGFTQGLENDPSPIVREVVDKIKEQSISQRRSKDKGMDI